MLKLGTLLVRKDTTATKAVSQLKCLEELKEVEIYLEIEGFGLAFFNTDRGHNSAGNFGNEFGVILKGKGPHKQEFAHDFVRMHSLMIYRDLIEDKIVGNTKAPLLRCFLFISKLKAGDIITIGQYMNYHNFGNLQFKPLL